MTLRRAGRLHHPARTLQLCPSYLDREMCAEEEWARLKGDNEAYRQARFTVERTAPGRQRIRLDYSRNGMDAIVSTTTWYETTGRGVVPRRIGRRKVSFTLALLVALIGALAAAAFGLGWRIVHGKQEKRRSCQ